MTLRPPDLPILAIAAAASTVIVVYLGFLAWDDRCLDAGGRVVVSGLDRVCDPGGGRTLPDRPLLTTAGWVGAAGLWLALVSALSWALGRFVRRGKSSIASGRSL